MTHIGIICPPLGHLNSILALGQELQRRKHCVTFFQMPDIEAKVLAAGLEFQAIGQSEYPVGSMNEYFVQLSKLRGLGELCFTLKCGQRLSCLNVPRLHAAVQRVPTEDSYRSSAARLKESILRAGGVGRAADIVEQVIATGQPVLAN